MSISVRIPTALRRFTGGAASVECSAATLAELLDDLGRQHPDLSRHLRDDSGQLRPFVNIYVNEEDIRFLGGTAYQFHDGDEVMLVPSIAGGAAVTA
ncbi:MAG TPA: MoaD/ThiS family protein [Patescibacteria group bacterium]|nr:MoaD/ThiS family protein [Patescibacteria group bacterium]